MSQLRHLWGCHKQFYDLFPPILGGNIISSACSRQCSSQANINTKRQYKRLKYISSQLGGGRKKPKPKAVAISSANNNGQIKNSHNDRVPLIVKMMSEHRSDNTLINGTDSVSHEELETGLKRIKHDFRAQVMKAEAIPEELPFISDDKETSNNSELGYVETIFLDDETQQERRTKKFLGTPLPGTGVSNIPCSGCGATLHCEDPYLPGYMRGEKFTMLTTDELRESVCQRCHLILNSNLCLDVKVDAKDYARIISNIKATYPLVIVMVDLLDIENSIFPNLFKSIGRNKQLFIVGNKVDLIPKDQPGYLQSVKSSLVNACEKAGLNKYNNIKNVSLISAKTGYGIEELIDRLLVNWGINGDVYLLGSTNTGKSTLFNALLQSDYCKSHVRDLIHRATTSIWSGTTLNLLKFPIMNPEPWKLVKRRVRLLKVKSEEMEEKKIEKRSTTVEIKPYSETILTANIEPTDFRGDLTIEKEAEVGNDVEFVGFERTKSGEVIDNIKDSDNIEKKKLSDLEKQFINVRWLYDTPGVIKTEQIVNLLKREEVKIITPKKRLIPRVFMFKPGEVMFITGLSRLDYIQGQNPIAITVFTDISLPVITLKSSDADSYYSKNIGGNKLKVPIDNTDHLPSLVARYFEVIGNGTRTLTADIQLSSLGWVSIAIQRAEVIGLRVYTPGGYGCHLRETPVLSNYKKFQGPRIKGTNRYKWTIPS